MYSSRHMETDFKINLKKLSIISFQQFTVHADTAHKIVLFRFPMPCCSVVSIYQGFCTTRCLHIQHEPGFKPEFVFIRGRVLTTKPSPSYVPTSYKRITRVYGCSPFWSQVKQTCSTEDSRTIPSNNFLKCLIRWISCAETSVTSSLRCVSSQKSEDLIHTAA